MRYNEIVHFLTYEFNKINRNLEGDFVYEVKIRAISIDDANEVCTICSEDLGYPCDLSLITEKTKNLNVNREAVFVALVDEHIVGFIHVEKYDVLYFETMANILGLAVKSEYRNNGIGKKLIFAAEEWAIENKIKGMRLNSGISRTNAHDFYRHLGYDSEKGQIRFKKNL